MAVSCKLTGMPELPDIAAYISALEPRIVGQPLARVRLASPFLLRPYNQQSQMWRAARCANCGESASESPSVWMETSGWCCT